MSVSLPRVRAVWPWLVEARHAWLAILVTIGALIIALRPNTTEPVIRLTGLILQLLGIATVIWGISETRKLFGHPSFAANAGAWLRRFPLMHRGVVLGAAAMSASSASVKGKGYVMHGVGGSPTLEARIDALEKNIVAIDERISEDEREVDGELRAIRESLRGETETRGGADLALGKRLEATGTGGVHISAIGALWLFVGVALSTAAPEIAGLLK